MHLPDRLKRSFGADPRQAVAARIAFLLAPRTPEEHERRRAHLFALLLVAVVATAKHVTGLTEGSASYTVYVLAIAVSALVGGFAPACVATMASVLLADAYAHSGIGSVDRIAFALEAMGTAALVGAMTSRLRDADAQLAATHAVNDELRAQVRRGHLAHHALEHLEDVAPDAAVFVVNAQGLIVDWPRSAERMYGYTAEQTLGASFANINAEPVAAPHAQDPLAADTDVESAARRTGVHRRSDGTRVHVDVEVKRCPNASEHFTVAVHDLSRRRETEAFREAALRAQAALQDAADEARGQLAALESLTDPSVNPVAGPAEIDELLERLRSTMHADGIALVQLGRTGTRVVAGAGLRPGHVRAPGAGASGGAVDGRVALVHNDATRVAHVSALTWSPTVSSIMVVPVCHTVHAAFRMEVVNERRAPATEWDLALARIVADRLAQAMSRQIPTDAAGAVA